MRIQDLSVKFLNKHYTRIEMNIDGVWKPIVIPFGNATLSECDESFYKDDVRDIFLEAIANVNTEAQDKKISDLVELLRLVLKNDFSAITARIQDELPHLFI